MKYDELEVELLEDNAALGKAVAAAFARAVTAAISERGETAVVLATGNSQLSFVDALADHPEIDWSRITVLHMDEYLGLPGSHDASFRRWMSERVATRFGVARFEGIAGDAADVDAEIKRYSDLIRTLRPAVTVMGIGENGHLAFNDPPADFHTSALAQVVDLDDVSRHQQVGEGHFPSFEETPNQAISLTIPALLASGTVLVGVPEARKAAAVARALEGEIAPESPASILRTAAHATLFLDRESAGNLTDAR